MHHEIFNFPFDLPFFCFGLVVTDHIAVERLTALHAKNTLSPLQPYKEI